MDKKAAQKLKEEKVQGYKSDTVSIDDSDLTPGNAKNFIGKRISKLSVTKGSLVLQLADGTQLACFVEEKRLRFTG